MDLEKQEALKYHWNILEQLVEKVYQSGLVPNVDISKQLNASIDFIKGQLFDNDCPECEK